MCSNQNAREMAAPKSASHRKTTNLAIDTTIQGQKYRFVSAHAPVFEDGSEAYEKYLKRMNQLMKCSSNRILIVGVDTHALIGAPRGLEEACHFAGTEGTQRDRRGQQLIEIVINAKAFVADTFSIQTKGKWTHTQTRHGNHPHLLD